MNKKQFKEKIKEKKEFIEICENNRICAQSVHKLIFRAKPHQ